MQQQRVAAVDARLRAAGARTVLDLGCGDGPLLTKLIRDRRICCVVGMDTSADALSRLRDRLKSLPEALQRKVQLIRGCMMAPGRDLSGFDAAVLVETLEHIDPVRLTMVETSVFSVMRPARVLITTPNADFNPLLGVPSYRFRHPDHRFEWGRSRFRSWADGVAARRGYTVTYDDLAGAHPSRGGASQLASFELRPKPA